jgi:HNH endonuclease
MIYAEFRKIRDQVRAEVEAKTQGRCWYCGIVLTRPGGQLPTESTIDHLCAVSTGSSDDLDNYVPACRGCNCRKRHLSLDAYRMFLMQKHPAACTQRLLQEALKTYSTPHDGTIQAAIGWLAEQVPPVVFWGEQHHPEEGQR